MKKILLCLIMLSMLLLSGCIRYGKGEAIGFVNAVDDGIIWDKVWFKTSMETSQEDCYLISDDNLKVQLRRYMGTDTPIKIKYDRHLLTFSAGCGEDSTDDEITGYEVVE